MIFYWTAFDDIEQHNDNGVHRTAKISMYKYDYWSVGYWNYSMDFYGIVISRNLRAPFSCAVWLQIGQRPHCLRPIIFEIVAIVWFGDSAFLIPFGYCNSAYFQSIQRHIICSSVCIKCWLLLFASTYSIRSLDFLFARWNISPVRQMDSATTRSWPRLYIGEGKQLNCF